MTNILDTYRNIYTRELGLGEPPISIPVALTTEHMAAVHAARRRQDLENRVEPAISSVRADRVMVSRLLVVAAALAGTPVAMASTPIAERIQPAHPSMASKSTC
jgi:hypothetical protein